MKIIDKIKVKFTYLTTDKYFPEDQEARNIYRVSVTYANNRTSFRFGDSIHNTQMGIMLDNKKDKNTILEIITSDYYTNKDNYPNYEEFAREFGYGEDSIKGLKIYKNCLKQAEKLAKVFSVADIEAIRGDLEI